MRYFRSRLKQVVLEKHGHLIYQEKIAEITGINRPTITRWMGGRLFRRLDMDIIEPLSEWLQCDPSDLYEIVEIDEETTEENTAALPAAL